MSERIHHKPNEKANVSQPTQGQRLDREQIPSPPGAGHLITGANRTAEILGLQRTVGNRAVRRLLAERAESYAPVTPSAGDLVQRRPLGEVANRPLASITFSSPGYVSAEATVTVEQELVSEDEQAGRFGGFSQRVEGYAQAWRHRDRLCAVVEDREGKYHTLKTDFSGRGTLEQVQVVPYQHEFARLWWVNLPRSAAGGTAGTGPQSWSARAGQAMNWYRRWKDGQVPPTFRCPHGAGHGGASPTLNDLRRCLEAEFVDLLSRALDVDRSDVHIVASGGTSSPRALVNFNLEMGDAKARSGISRLPADRSATMPEPTVTFGPLAFESQLEIQLLGTAIHEAEHVSHAELGIAWLQRWRRSRTRGSFTEWLRGQLRRRRLSREQYDLVIGQTRAGEDPATETLAHLQGFMATYDQMPITEDRYRFEQIDKGAEFWALAGHAINDSSIARLTSYYRSLDAAHKHDFAAHAREMQRTTVSPYRLFWNRVVRVLFGGS